MKNILVPICLGFINISCDSDSFSNMSDNSAENLTVSDFNVVSTTVLDAYDLRFSLRNLIPEVNNLEVFSSTQVLEPAPTPEQLMQPVGCNSTADYYNDNQYSLVYFMDDLDKDLELCYGDEVPSNNIVTLSFIAKYSFFDQYSDLMTEPLVANTMISTIFNAAVSVNYIVRTAVDGTEWGSAYIAQITDSFTDYTVVNQLDSGGSYQYKAVYSSDGFNAPCYITRNLISNCIIHHVDKTHGISGSSDNPQQLLLHTSYSNIRLELNNLILDTTGPFYESGTIDFILDSWTGTITFSGANVSPSYVASNGMQTESGIIEW
ncbi:MAG: hypothetical protein OEX07_15245 [Gammaproteobacteria bacterium]|nr:hypothetical protein [Gammaproteobacteria bacterium]